MSVSRGSGDTRKLPRNTGSGQGCVRTRTGRTSTSAPSGPTFPQLEQACCSRPAGAQRKLCATRGPA
eukprot:3739558-Rhodomonas_salina.1